MVLKIFAVLVFQLFLVPPQSPGTEEARKLLLEKNYVKAEKILMEFLLEYPRDPEARELLGDARAHQKNWTGAISIYRELVLEQQENADYHFKYAAALAMKVMEMPKIQGVFYVEEIREHLLKAASLDAGHVEVRWALMELHLKLPAWLGGGEGPALEYALQLEKISPVDGHLARGHLFESLGNYGKAELHYLKAVNTGGSLHCYRKLSDLYLLKLRKPLKAILAMEKALERHGDNSLRLQIGRVAAAHQLIPEKARAHLENYLLQLPAGEKKSAQEATALLEKLGTGRKN